MASCIFDLVEFAADSLLNVFGMDLHFFSTAVPVVDEIWSVVLAAGWALLLGNLIFQATKSMMSGLGFEGEDPRILFSRTFVFSFLLLISRQICDIGLAISSTVIELLQVVDAVHIPRPDESQFNTGASWLLVIIIGIVITWQVFKLFVSMGERYVVVAILTFLSPLAFSMGGSKSTAEIFKGWARMFVSMCFMMVTNIIFLKMLMSALQYMPDGVDTVPWAILIVGIARVAKKIDDLITRIGMNPAMTGNGLGRSLPGMVSYMVMRNMGQAISKSAGNAVGAAKRGSSTPPTGGGSPVGSRAASGGGRTSGDGTGRRNAPDSSGNRSSEQNTISAQIQTDGGTSVSHQNQSNTQGGTTPANGSASIPNNPSTAQSSSPGTDSGNTPDSGMHRDPANQSGMDGQSMTFDSAPGKGGTDGKGGRNKGNHGNRRTSAQPGAHTSYTRQGSMRNGTIHGGSGTGKSAPQGGGGTQTTKPGTQTTHSSTQSGKTTASPAGQGGTAAYAHQNPVPPSRGKEPNGTAGKDAANPAAQRPPIGRAQPAATGATGKEKPGLGTPARYSAVTDAHKQASSRTAESKGGQERGHQTPPTPHQRQSVSAGTAGTESAHRPSRPPIGGKQAAHRMGTDAPPHGGGGRESSNGQVSSPSIIGTPQQGGQATTQPPHTSNPQKAGSPAGAAGTAPHHTDTPNHPTRPPIRKTAPPRAGTADKQAAVTAGGDRNGAVGYALGPVPSTGAPKGGQERPLHPTTPQTHAQRGGSNQPTGHTPAPVISTQAPRGGQERPSRSAAKVGTPQSLHAGGGRNSPAPHTSTPVSSASAPKGGQERAHHAPPSSAQKQSASVVAAGKPVTTTAPKGGLQLGPRAAQYDTTHKRTYRFQNKEKK